MVVATIEASAFESNDCFDVAVIPNRSKTADCIRTQAIYPWQIRQLTSAWGRATQAGAWQWNLLTNLATRITDAGARRLEHAGFFRVCAEPVGSVETCGSRSPHGRGAASERCSSRARLEGPRATEPTARYFPNLGDFIPGDPRCWKDNALGQTVSVADSDV